MKNYGSSLPHRILIASANPLFSKGLRKLFANWQASPAPEMRLANSMADTLSALKDWAPDLVVVDYDDRTINRAEFLNHFVASNDPMQVMLVSLQASGEVVVYDRRTLTPDQAEDWLNRRETEAEPTSLPAETALPHSNGRVKLEQPASFFNWRWGFLIAAVVLLFGAFIRLGFWQLDRLAQRRAYNARVEAEIGQPALNLNATLPVNDLAGMEYRSAVVTGTYDLADEVVLSNQVWDENKVGVHLLTPLKIDGSDNAILVDRGWVPLDQAGLPERQQYAEAGNITVKGIIRASQQRSVIFGVQEQVPTSGRQDRWSTVNLEAIQKQTRLKLLPIFVQEAPDPTWTRMPYRKQPDIQLTEGPHLGYAIQWFLFATILAVGFPIFLRAQMRAKREHQSAAHSQEPLNHNV